MRNAYVAMQEIRAHLGERTAKHWLDEDILGALIRAETGLVRKVQGSPGDWLVKRSDALTPVSNTIYFPSDCAKPVSLVRVSDGLPIPFGAYSVREKYQWKQSAYGLRNVGLSAFLLDTKLEVNTESFTDPCYLYYERRIPDVHFGTAAAGGANSITLQDDRHRRREDDHYNGMTLEVISGTGAGTSASITDYTGSTGVAVVSGTFGNDSVYGTIPMIAKDGWDAWIMRALWLLVLKPTTTITKEYFYFIRDEAKKTEDEFDRWLENQAQVTSRVISTGAYQHG